MRLHRTGKLISTLPGLEADGKHVQSPIARFSDGLNMDDHSVLPIDVSECTPNGADPHGSGDKVRELKRRVLVLVLVLVLVIVIDIVIVIVFVVAVAVCCERGRGSRQ
jgi:hypothetical protein